MATKAVSEAMRDKTENMMPLDKTAANVTKKYKINNTIICT